MAMQVDAPLMALPLSLAKINVVMPTTPALMEEDIAMPAILVLLPPSGEHGKLEVVPMEVMEVSTPLDEAFLVKAVMPWERVPIKVGDVIILQGGAPSVDGALAFNPCAKMVNMVNSSMAV